MERRRTRAAAADRRRDDLAPAHGGQDRARLRERDGARARREPGRRRRLGAPRPEAPRRRSTSRTASSRSGCASSTRRRCAGRCCRSSRRGPTGRRSIRRPAGAAVHAARARSRARRSASSCPYIDWQFFFHAWDLKGKFPAILDNPAARELYDDALATARARSCASGSLQARGVYGFWPARAEGDDVVLDGTRFCFLRQQAENGDGRPNRCLADYVAPAGDHLGAFAVAIHGADELAARLRGRARRLQGDHRQGARRPARRGVRRVAAPAGAPRVVRARRASPSDEDLMRETFRGIRPAFGYPACPDHSEKGKLFDLLGAERVGLELTESYAMMPGGRGQRHLPRAPAGEVLRGRPDRARPARGLRAPERPARGGSRALALSPTWADRATPVSFAPAGASEGRRASFMRTT